MPVHNADIAAIFDEIADLLDIQGANTFRVRAYRNAARSIGNLGIDLAQHLKDGRELPAIPGIGADLSGKIREIAGTGRCAFLDRLHDEIPHAITELLRLPGLGPKRVKTLYQDLKVDSIAELHAAAQAHRVSALPGFGRKLEERILAGIDARAGTEARMRLAVAMNWAEPLIRRLAEVPGAEKVVLAGSARRMRESVGDLDIVVAAEPGTAVMDRFRTWDDVATVNMSGPTRSSVQLRCGLQVDLRLVPDGSFGAALLYFTGSKAHNIALRRIAQDRQLKLNEYGLFQADGTQVAGDTEESVYAALGLAWIPPELREATGEIECAADGTLPDLVELADLRGDLHAHTDASDGRASLADMAAAAATAGLQYLAITDHSGRTGRGLDADALARQGEAIDRLNEKLAGITLLKGIEVDILRNGSLDLPDAALASLDLVVASVHRDFDLPRAQQTARLMRAMDHPHFSILGHPNARLLDERDGIDVDMEQVIAHARQRGCFLELNAQPARLDLYDAQCRLARDAGVRVSVASDAHDTGGFHVLRYGVGMARRGWLRRNDVLNTVPLRRIRALLAATMGRTA